MLFITKELAKSHFFNNFYNLNEVVSNAADSLCTETSFCDIFCGSVKVWKI